MRLVMSACFTSFCLAIPSSPPPIFFGGVLQEEAANMAPPLSTTYEIIMLLLILATLSSDCHCHLPYIDTTMVVSSRHTLRKVRCTRVIEMIAKGGGEFNSYVDPVQNWLVGNASSVRSKPLPAICARVIKKGAYYVCQCVNLWLAQLNQETREAQRQLTLTKAKRSARSRSW